MSTVKPVVDSLLASLLLADDSADVEQSVERPLVSIVVPAYNEAAIVEKNLASLCEYLKSLESDYRWEIIFLDDGSTDETGELAEAFAREWDGVRVFHHPTNCGLGQALQSAFSECRGDYVVTLDLDLSYSPDHIRRMLRRIRDTKSKVVLASPYTEGGRISNVPWLRRMLSKWANRFLAIAARGNVSTLTGMVRAYDGRFLKTVDLRATGMDINPETIYKAMLLRARIEEVPAHLDWGLQRATGTKRKSSMRVLRHTVSVVLSGFVFRPFMFFMLPGLLLFLFSCYVNAWMIAHFLRQYQNFSQVPWFLDRASAALAAAYQLSPHTFIVGLSSLIVAIQLISLGIMSLQSKRYFEEIFHLGTTVLMASKKS
jgi:glycosyltransferase involved in cell wall biosynthesis